MSDIRSEGGCTTPPLGSAPWVRPVPLALRAREPRGEVWGRGGTWRVDSAAWHNPLLHSGRFWWLALVLAVVWGAAPQAQTAACSDLSADAAYRIQNRNSALFLRPDGDAVGAEVVQQPQDLNDPSQTWRFVAVEGGARIVNVATELAAAPRDGAGTARTPVVQEASDAASAGQGWAVEDGPPGYCRFRHVESGLYLRLSSPGAGQRAFVDTLTERFHSQQWAVTEVGANTGPPDPPPGERLRALAAERWGLRIGAAARSNFYNLPDSVRYEAVFAREFSSLTPEGATKWKALRPTRDAFDFSGADRMVAFAEANGMTFHGHTLAWHQDANPEKHPDHWLPTADPADAEALLGEHIDRVVSRYAGRVAVWDVVNEAISPRADEVRDGRAPFRTSFWAEGMGIGAGGVPNFIRFAFRRARQNDATARLIYNEVGGISTPTRNSSAPEMQTTALAMVDQLQSEGVPIDGFGLQTHIFSDQWGVPDQASWVNFATALGERGLDVYITEFDVAIPTDSPAEIARQTQIYAEVVERFLHLERRADLTLWGFTDRYSWRNPDDDGVLRYPLPLDVNYLPKPAYDAVQRVLAGGTAREADRDGLARFEAEGHEAQRGARTLPFARDAAGQLQGRVEAFETGDYLKFARTALAGARSVRVTYASESPLALELRVGAPDGDLLGTVALAPTGGPDVYAEATADLSTAAPAGPTDLYVVGVTAREDGDARLDWLAFSAAPVASEPGASGAAFRLLSVGPNPTAGVVTVRFDLPAATEVTARVFDALGREVLVPTPAAFAAGASQSLALDASRLPVGVYVVRLAASGISATGRFTVVR